MRLYYTTDLHGSTKCWKKFLATPKYYQADVIVIGGDITGKLIVPIVHPPRGRVEATFMGRKRKFRKEKDIEQFKQIVADSGQYPVEMTKELALDQSLDLDEDGFAAAMEEQKERARGKSFHAVEETGDGPEFVDIAPVEETEFIGYDLLECEASAARVRSFVEDDAVFVDLTGGWPLPEVPH